MGIGFVCSSVGEIMFGIGFVCLSVTWTYVGHWVCLLVGLMLDIGFVCLSD